MTPPRYFSVHLGMTVVMSALLHSTNASNPSITDAAERSVITPLPALEGRDVPMSLLGLAGSLLSEYYPNSHFTNLAGLTLPPTVVFDGQTIVVSPDATAKSSHTKASATDASNTDASGMTTSKTSRSKSDGSSTAKNTGASATNSDGSSATQTSGTSGSNANGASSTSSNGGSPTGSSSSDHSGATTDKHHGLSAGKIAGIVVGTLLGVALFALLLFCCLKCREKRSRKRAAKHSSHEKEPGSWHEPEPYNIPPPHHLQDNGYHQQGYGPNVPANTQQHHGGLNHSPHHDQYNNIAGQNPYSSEQQVHHNGHPHGLNSNNHGMGTAAGAGLVGAGASALAARHHHNNKQHSHSPSNSNGQIPRRPIGNNNNHSPPRQRMAPLPLKVNPRNSYDSPGAPHGEQHYGDEGRDIVSPIVPVRSNERRHSPRMHYPTRNEVSEFDFSDQGRNSSFDSSPRRPQQQHNHQQQPQYQQSQQHQQSWKHTYDDSNGWQQTEGHGNNQPVRQSFNYRDDGHGWQDGGLAGRRAMS